MKGSHALLSRFLSANRNVILLTPVEDAPPPLSEKDAIASYDEGQYNTMTSDVRRNAAYQRAFEALHLFFGDHVKWLEIGPGRDAVLSVMAAGHSWEAQVIAVEGNPAVCDRASRALKGNPRLSKTTRVYCGYSTDRDIVAEVSGFNPDFLVSEIFGNILSQEALPAIIQAAHDDRLIGKSTRVIPRYGATLMTPADVTGVKTTLGRRQALLGDTLCFWVGLDPAILTVTGGRSALFEFYDFQKPGVGSDQKTRAQHLRVTRSGNVNIIILTIWVDMGVQDIMKTMPKRKRLELTQTGTGCEELDKLVPVESISFVSAPHQPNSASNWMPVGIFLPDPWDVIEKDVVILSSEAYVSTTSPHYRLHVELHNAKGSQRQSINISYAELRQTWQR